MEFRTVVEYPQSLSKVTHAHRMMMLGSCFAENMGQYLEANKFNIDINPFGILYNPFSIAKELNEIAAGKSYDSSHLFEYKGCWHSPMHHSIFSSTTVEETLLRINSRLQQAQQQLPTLHWMMITFGTAFVYQMKETGEVVANCHKLPENQFIRRRLSVEEIIEVYVPLIRNLLLQNAELKFLFTVSPIRHARDGMPQNQLSKSTLLLAIDELCKLFPEHLSYFPSYEIMIDELRDYRFYADDMIHPSPLAIRYIWERFCATYFSKETTCLMEEIDQINRALEHKPFHPESITYQRFVEQTAVKIEQLITKYPYLDLKKELKLCRTRLNP